MYEGLGNNLMNGKQGTKEKSDGFYRLLLLSLLVMLMGYLLVKTYCHGIDRTIRSQDTMLCESALISGNKEYLEKCECYYETDDIGCLQGGGE